MKMKNYKKMVNDHYTKEAVKEQLSLTSTMHDINVRQMEIKCHLKYLNDGMNCLEIGCGNGYATKEISKQRHLDILAIDSNKEMILLANKLDLIDIKGNIEFQCTSVLDMNTLPEFDTVYTTRCIINLLDWKDQKKALQNMSKAVKQYGKLVMIEAYTDGLEQLNKARNEFGLEEIKAVKHNLHLDKDKVIEFLLDHDMKFLHEDNFLSSYYYWTRVIYPALARSNNREIVKNSRFDYFFSHFPSYGNFAHIKTLVFSKN
jgi:ubiquinone/menaquinone biosynthesis C-methylase UbiE